MALDRYDPDWGCEPGEAGWRAPPRCYARPAIPISIAASRRDEDGSAQARLLGIALIVLSCIAAYLALRHGWSA